MEIEEKKARLKKYYEIRPIMNTGDLVEWAGNTTLGWAIRKFTGKNVNHSAIVLRIADFCGLKDRRFVLEATGHGITLNLLSDRLAEFDGSVYWSCLKPDFDDKRDEIGTWALLQAGCYEKGAKKQYDYRSLFINAIRPVSVDAKQWFCSEYCHAALIESGVLPTGCTAARPGDFEQYGVFLKTMQIL